MEKKRSGPLAKKMATALEREGLWEQDAANQNNNDFTNQNNKMSLSEYQKAQSERRSRDCNFLQYAFLFEPSLRDTPKNADGASPLLLSPATSAASTASVTKDAEVQVERPTAGNVFEKMAQLEASFSAGPTEVAYDFECDDEVQFVDEVDESGLVVVDEDKDLEVEEGFTLI